jgi:PilZ domain
MATVMDKALGSAWAPVPTIRKNSARVALVDTKESSRLILSECFRQFGMEPIILREGADQRLMKEKFSACVVPLLPGAETILEGARLSASNSHIVIYGLGGSAQDAMRFSKYGVNAVFHEPLERSSALKLVRATQTLLLHEFRRYVRIPVITEISVEASDGRRFSATSLEISSGGMSLRTGEDIDAGQPVEISFALLTLPRIWVRGVVTWRKPSMKTMGIRFDASDERRLRIKEWVDAYFEN